MLKLHDISIEVDELDKMVDEFAAENEGLVPEFLNDELDRLKGERVGKLLNLAVWVKNLKAEAEAFSPEIKRLQARQKALNNKADTIKEYIDYNMQEGEKLSDTRAVLSYRKSTQVVIDVLTEDLPSEVVKISFTPDKTAIKEAIKKGDCHYAHMQENQSLQIK